MERRRKKEKKKGELLPGFEPGSREDPDKYIKIPDANLYTTRAGYLTKYKIMIHKSLYLLTRKNKLRASMQLEGVHYNIWT